jgi:hypothetical protein
MYTTIEADIRNGRIQSAESQQIPAEAHVLITFLHEKPHVLPESGSADSLRGAFKQYANSQLVAEEKVAWGQAAQQKHETD